MPKKFIKAERAIERKIKSGEIPKTYVDSHGIRHKSNPYALARHATGYHETTFDIGLKHPKKKKHHKHHHHHHHSEEQNEHVHNFREEVKEMFDIGY